MLFFVDILCEPVLQVTSCDVSCLHGHILLVLKLSLM